LANDTTAEVYLNSFSHILLHTSGISEVIYSQTSQIIHQLNTYFELGSNWGLQSILEMPIQASRYNPIRHGSFIPTPAIFKRRNSLYNIKVDTNQCFQYCVIAKLYSLLINNNLRKYAVENPRTYTHFIDTQTIVNFQNLTTGEVTFSDIKRFKSLNPEFSVNIFLVA